MGGKILFRGLIAAACFAVAVPMSPASASDLIPGWDGLGFAARMGPATVAFARSGAAHVDLSGHIDMFLRGPGSDVWASRTIFDSPIDDRNAAGGVTPTGRIVVFFGRYNPARDVWPDMGYIWSADLGKTWSRYATLPMGDDSRFSPYGSMVVLPTGRLMQLVYGTNDARGRVRAFFSDDDGITWGGSRLVIQMSERVQPTEASATLVSGLGEADSTIVAVVRTGPWAWQRSFAGGLTQVVSRDGGRTWRTLGRLPFSASHNDVSPWVSKLPDGRVALVWTDRVARALKLSYARGSDAASTVARWTAPVTIAASRGVAKGSWATANFGYPSIVVPSAVEPAQITYYDVAPMDRGAKGDTTPSYTELVTVPLTTLSPVAPMTPAI